MRCHPLCAATVGLLVLPAVAVAAPAVEGQPALGLRWSDPNFLAPTTERDFDAELGARLGHAAFAGGREDATLSVTWLGTPQRCRVELSLARPHGVEGTRILESPNGDCRSLVPALLTVSALLVESYESAAPLEATLPSAPPPAPALPPPSPSPPRTSASPTSAATVLLSVGGALSSGFVPKVELGPAVAAAWAPRGYVRLGLTGALFVGHDYGEGPGLSLQHRRAALFACGMPLSQRVALGVCGNFGWHHFHGSGTSLPRPEANDVSTWSVGAELRAEWRLSPRLWWVGHAGADVATKPLYFYYTTADGAQRNVFEQRRVNPVLLVALSLELP